MTAEDQDVPAIDFATFILSLSTSALTHLGVSHPGAPPEFRDARASAPPPQVQLVLAKQTIDLIELLEEKTAGNLSGGEENLVNQVLEELKAEYQKKAKHSA